jgi:DNA-binding transcriptional regulator YhcF (GntR family)
MNSENIYSHILIDSQSLTPKYLQLTNSILKGIELGKLGKNYFLPSINNLSYELEISRDTAEKAYRHLKNVGILGSVPGKGCFIAKTDFVQKFRILLLFNKLSAHKKIIYDSMVAVLGKKAAIDFHIYNNDFSIFKKTLSEIKDTYTHVVIIPHFLDGGENAYELVNELKCPNLILLDKKIPGITRPFGAVYENFEKDIFCALEQALPKLKKYQTIKIICPSYTYFPEEILHGFFSFCKKYDFKHDVVNSVANEQINEGDVYINLMEDDLTILLDKIRQTELKVGKDVGIISYNETPLKRFILDGITTISTNFAQMGEATARMILDNKLSKFEVPFTLTLRASL